MASVYKTSKGVQMTQTISRKNVPTISKLEFSKLYFERHMSLKQIAKSCNIPLYFVRKLFKEYSFDTLQLNREVLYDLFINCEKSIKEISIELNVPEKVISNWLTVCNLKRNSNNDIDEKELVSLYRCGHSIKNISDKFKVSKRFVISVLNKNDISLRLYGKSLEEPIKEILERLILVEKLTNNQIATIYQTDVSTVSRWVQTYKIAQITERKFYHLIARPFSKQVKEVLIGLLMGKAVIKDSYIEIEDRLKNIDFFFFKKSVLKDLINTCRVSNIKNDIKLYSKTINHNEVNVLSKRFATLDILRDFGEISLAYWIMDSATIYNKNNIRINSSKFSEKEHDKIIEMLKVNFNLNANKLKYKRNGKEYCILFFNKRNSELLSDIIRPHIIDQLKYKLVDCSSTTEHKASDKEGDTV
jgi:transposase